MGQARGKQKNVILLGLNSVDGRVVDVALTCFGYALAYSDGRLGLAAESAALVCWLASEECSFSTAATFDISGGRRTY
jgi:NAD(P)-dependent dehydrogenase (short-subunit alcohol dehydrogenase family)